MDEVWKPIGGFEDRYEVSNCGRIRSINGLRKIRVSSYGYGIVSFWALGSAKSRKHFHFAVHRLVWETFNGPIPKDKVIDHINSDRLNNNLSNLRLASFLQNTVHTKKLCKPCSSIYKGVTLRTLCNGKVYWEGAIRQNGTKVYLGKFNSEIEAAIAYDLKAIALHGAFARTNLIHTADFIERNKNGSPTAISN